MEQPLFYFIKFLRFSNQKNPLEQKDKSILILHPECRQMGRSIFGRAQTDVSLVNCSA